MRTLSSFVELEAGTEVDNDAPLLYRVDVHLEGNTPSDVYHQQQVCELSRLDDVIVYVKVDPTPGELKLGESESGRLRERLEDIPYRALTVVLEKVSAKDFMTRARTACGKMQIPIETPRILIHSPFSPLATSLPLTGQDISVETRFMTRTGPLTPEEARFSLRVGEAEDER
jgi:hypothetical protein